MHLSIENAVRTAGRLMTICSRNSKRNVWWRPSVLGARYTLVSGPPQSAAACDGLAPKLFPAVFQDLSLDIPDLKILCVKYDMPPRRQQAWNELHEKMSNKRTRNEGNSKKGSAFAPHEIIVQRLSSEPDNKQTYRPVQPREFVSFSYNDLNLVNLKKACADHFNVPVGSVDVLVSNKGPSATNVNQIPHRKDKVSLSVYLCNTILPSTWSAGSSVVVSLFVAVLVSLICTDGNSWPHLGHLQIDWWSVVSWARLINILLHNQVSE